MKRHQTRKGFLATASSLNVQVTLGVSTSQTPLPDVPVLNDSARELPEPQRLAIESQAEANFETAPSPVPPAEQPSAAQSVAPDEVKRLVDQYLRDGEGDNVDAQTAYFAYPVEYFDHGVVGADFVRKDVANYVKRWPERKYELTSRLPLLPPPAMTATRWSNSSLPLTSGTMNTGLRERRGICGQSGRKVTSSESWLSANSGCVNHRNERHRARALSLPQVVARACSCL
ncbi:MAG: hypothetical protein H0T11_06055 [Chthoniobacterales bacterium]|nr:hypothetical protein [Chthoniobacterales bacterium]